MVQNLTFLKRIILIFPTILCLCFINSVYSQLRQIHVETTANDILKTSFYSLSEGYVAFHDFVGFTTDSGRTFTAKYISNTNVNFNGYTVNVTFGFEILGVIALSKNNIIVFGDYGDEPSILYSSDQGSSFVLVYHSPLLLGNPEGFVYDMVFAPGGSVGYAANGDQILKTMDGGITWNASGKLTAASINNLQLLDDNQVFAFSNYANNTALYFTSNGGDSWQQISVPVGNIMSAYFLSASTGYVDIDNGAVYFTNNGGADWAPQNNTNQSSIVANKIIFTNDSTAYATAGNFEVYKTSNSGKIWERLARNNNYTYLNYSFNAMQISGNSVWAGGGHGFLELSTNAGGLPIPKAIFTVDTSTVSSNGMVKLDNYSKTGYNYTWLRDGKKISNGYDTSYVGDIYGPNDTITLIVANKQYADTVTQYTSFSRAAKIDSFTPTTGPIGTTVNISGENFYEVTGVSFGGTPAASFTVKNPYYITAVVATGASGTVTVTTAKSHGSLPGFVFVPPPKITSFSPQAAVDGATITITGTNFNQITKVTFGGVPPKSFAVISPTEIQAILDYGSNGDIIVYSANGNDTAHNFKVLPLIISVNPNSGSFGTTIDLVGRSLGDITDVTVDGYPAVWFENVSGTELSFQVGNGNNGPSTITITGPGGSATYTGFTYYLPPVISSFSPKQAAAGESLTLSGSNFNVNPDANTVYFGGMRAKITAVSATSLTVTVPAGAPYKPISVISNQHIAFSDQPFSLVFKGGGTIDTNSFKREFNFLGKMYSVLNVADLNNDGLPDIVTPVVGDSDDAFYLETNQSKNGVLNFNFGIGYGPTGSSVSAVTDLNMDGKPDLVFFNNNDLAGFLNNNATGAANANDFLYETIKAGTRSSGQTYDMDVNDMDGDGRQDVITAVSFSASAIQLGDIDGDSKVDAVVASGNIVSIYRNTSVKGNINYAAKVDLDAGAPIVHINLADFDGDGKPDIAVLTNNGLIIFINTSSGPNISFFQSQSISNLSAPTFSSVGDLDGDGKIDIVVAASKNLYIYKNTGSTGNVSFAQPVIIATDVVSGILICDLDGDGRPDISAIVQGTNQGFILRNLIGVPQVASFTPSQGPDGTSIDITGTNFTSATSVTIGGYTVKSYTVNSPTSITAIAGADTTGFIAVRTPYSVGTSTTPFNFIFQKPAITSFSPSSGGVSQVIQITGTNFSAITAVTIGGKNVSSFTVTSPASITIKAGTGTSGNINVITAKDTVTSKDTFTFLSPQIFSFSPSGGANGTAIEMKGAFFTGATNVTIGGKKVSSFAADGDSVLRIWAGADTTGFITVVTPIGKATSASRFTFINKATIIAAGPLIFDDGGSVKLEASPTDTSFTYAWAKDGELIPNAKSASYTASVAGTYTVTIYAGIYNFISSPVSVRTVFSLPVTNFTVSGSSVTCRGDSNGSITIAADSSLNYTVAISGDGINQTLAFKNTVTCRSLSAGNYNVCVTVAGQADYQQCFSVEITQPADLSVYASVNPKQKTLDLLLSGGDSYHITMNNVSYTTSASSVSLPLDAGTNKLVVNTDKLCQGTVEKLINIDDFITPYPNPFQDVININLGSNIIKKATVKIINVNGWRILYSNDYISPYGVIQVDASKLGVGVYILSLTLDNRETLYKISK